MARDHDPPRRDLVDHPAERRAHLLDDVADANGRDEIIARHDDRDPGTLERLRDERHIRLGERAPIAAVDEEQDRRALAGRENIEQAARPGGIALVELATAARAQSFAAAAMAVIDLIALRMPLAQRE